MLTPLKCYTQLAEVWGKLLQRAHSSQWLTHKEITAKPLGTETELQSHVQGSHAQIYDRREREGDARTHRDTEKEEPHCELSTFISSPTNKTVVPN